MSAQLGFFVGELDLEKNLKFFAKSGLEVNLSDDIWILLPNNGKGRAIKIGWVRSLAISQFHRELIFDVFIYYVRTKAAATASSIVVNVKPYIEKGIPSLHDVKMMWSGLKTSNKKGVNQFFGTLSKLGHSQFDEYHIFTRSNLDKSKSNSLDSFKGALTDFEFDSFAKNVNKNVQSFDWKAVRSIDFYRSEKLFGRVRNRVTNKLLLAIVRRPIQLSVLKWSDLVPAGSSFKDPGILHSDEIGTVGGDSLQLRVFVAKSTGARHPRDFPERYPIPLFEDLSRMLVDYKKLVYNGIKLALISAGLKPGDCEQLRLMDNVPMFPDSSLFEAKYESLEMFDSLFTKNSTAYHNSETSIAATIKFVDVASDRMSDCVVSSNRIRHTVLTRGAQDGLPADQLAKLTGVTVPAARHYIDLDYISRRLIDTHYVGNEFLKHAFSGCLSTATTEDSVFDSGFNPVGSVHDGMSCRTCATNMGRPLGCYGCPNFRPLLEADHMAVLAEAERKLEINRNSLANPLHRRSIEKLERQIGWVRITIDVCDENLGRLRTVVVN